MLEAARLDPAHEITYVAHRAVSVTAEKVAINAVMAGCRPEYMPVVVAAIEGIGDPALELPRARHLDGGGRRPPHRQRADRARAGRQRGRQPLRARVAGQPHDRARRPARDAQRLRLPARNPRPGNARTPGQALLRDRRERGREPLAAAPRRAGLPARPERRDRRGRGGAAAVLQPALEHRGGRPDHPRGRHASLREPHGPAATSSSCSPASTCGRSPATAGPRR